MDRRTFLKSTTAAAAATTATAGTVQAQQALASPAITTARREMRIAVPDTPHLADAALELTRDIEIASGGRIILNQAEAAMPTATAVAAGDIDGAYGHVAEICANPALALFTGLPGDMALTPGDLITWHIAAGGDMFLDEAAAEYDLTAMIAGHSGAMTGLWANRELFDLRDVAAAHMETIGLGGKVIDTIRGAHNHPVQDTSSANLIELAASPLVAMMDVPKSNRRTWYRDSLHNQGFATTLVLSQDAWFKLQPGDQLLIRSLSHAAAHNALARVRASDRLVAPSVLAAQSTSRKPLPADISSAFRHVATQVTYDGMSLNSQMTPAFQAYGAFYEALMGVALPGAPDYSVHAIS